MHFFVPVNICTHLAIIGWSIFILQTFAPQSKIRTETTEKKSYLYYWWCLFLYMLSSAYNWLDKQQLHARSPCLPNTFPNKDLIHTARTIHYGIQGICGVPKAHGKVLKAHSNQASAKRHRRGVRYCTVLVLLLRCHGGYKRGWPPVSPPPSPPSSNSARVLSWVLSWCRRQGTCSVPPSAPPSSRLCNSAEDLIERPHHTSAAPYHLWSISWD